MKAGPASMARGWRQAHAVLAGEQPGDPEWARRTIAMLERRCPDAALRCVTRPALLTQAREAGWAAARAPWRIAPGQGQREDEIIFYRGPREAWKVGFDRGPDGWQVDAIAPAPRVID